VETRPILDFLAAVIRIIAAHLAAHGEPRGRSVVTFTQAGFATAIRDDVRWDIVVWTAFRDSDLGKLPEADAAAEALRREKSFSGWGVILPADISLKEFKSWGIHQLMFVLQRYLTRRGAAVVDDVLLSQILSEFVHSWKSPNREDELLVPLFGLEVGQRVQFDNHTWIAPFTEEEKNSLWSSWEAELRKVNVFAYGNAGSCIHALSTEPRPRLNSSIAHVIDRCGRLLSALRLAGAGEVYSGAVVVRALPPVIEAQSMVYGLLEFRHGGIRIGAHYEWTDNSEKTVSDIYARLGGRDKDIVQALSLAIRRFNLAQSRDHTDDEIVDLAIALESCLLSGFGTELSYRFMLRGAHVAGLKQGNNQAPLLKAVYDVRSAIVHGGKTMAALASGNKLLGMTEQHFISEVRSATRDILRWYLEQVYGGKPLAEINAEIEASISRRVVQ